MPRCVSRAYSKSLHLLLLLTFVLFWQASPVAGRIYIDINSPLQKKIPIAIPAFRHEGGDSAGLPLAERLADTLGRALAFSGLFEVLSKAMFLEDPQVMGTTLGEIKFAEWSFLGADLLVRGTYRIRGNLLEMSGSLFDVVHQKLLLTKAYEGDIGAARQMALRFGDDMMSYLTGEPGIFTSKIAFVGDATGHKEIYFADFDGSHIVRLTHDNNIDLQPAWSADGKRISYVSYKSDQQELYVVDLMTGIAKKISRRSGLNMAPAWHPRENKIAVTLTIDGNPEIYLLDDTGRILKQLTKNWAIDVSPSWCPDGSKVAYVSNRGGKPQIYILDLHSLSTEPTIPRQPGLLGETGLPMLALVTVALICTSSDRTALICVSSQEAAATMKARAGRRMAG